MMTLIYEGKGKKVFAQDQAPLELIVEFKNDLTAFNAQKRGSFEDKGAVSCRISSLIFEFLESQGVKTHLLGQVNPTQVRVQSLKMIPLEVVIRNRVAGSLAQKMGRTEGEKLLEPCVEFYFKDDKLGDPFLSVEQVLALGISDLETVRALQERAQKINHLLVQYFSKAQLDLVDFKIEFGRNHQGEILLGDDISPDSCRLWDMKTQEKFDKDRFRRDLGNVGEAYREVLQRLESL
ncbi:MAG: phosphoribosylaminoimidazolesuccinocarboxamide synthase [Pseudobdellovibrionaceae bacterium]|jgi:phosphoribosylaminoimidazole-succinocarboxamide synthase